MQPALHLTTKVLPGNKIEIEIISSELILMEVLVLPSARAIALISSISVIAIAYTS